jgi:hypothetical protein
MECGINIDDVLPSDAFFGTRYYDQSRNFVTRRIYYSNGRVEAFDGEKWWTVCRLISFQIELAKQAIVKSGLSDAKDLTASGVYDAAVLSFAWRFSNQSGMVTNWVYPALDHPVFEKLEEELDKLENITNSN